MGKRFAFTDYEQIRSLYQSLPAGEKPGFIETYRRYCKAFKIPSEVMDTDVLFGTKDQADARKEAEAAEIEARVLRSIYDGW